MQPQERRISPVELAAYEDEGFIVFPALFTAAEIAAVADEVSSVFERADVLRADNLRCRFQRHFETGERLLEAVDPIVDLLPGIAELAASRRILCLLEQLLGAPACLFKDKLVLKPPGSLGYGLHQDFIAWPDFPRSFTTITVAIDRATEENGCIELFHGYHGTGPLAPSDGDYHDLVEAHFDPSRRVKLELAPGDAVVFGCFVPHGSAPNRSTRPRRHLLLSYNRADDGGELRESHYRDFHRWLRGKYAEHGVTDLMFR